MKGFWTQRLGPNTKNTACAGHRAGHAAGATMLKMTYLPGIRVPGRPCIITLSHGHRHNDFTERVKAPLNAQSGAGKAHGPTQHGLGTVAGSSVAASSILAGASPAQAASTVIEPNEFLGHLVTVQQQQLANEERVKAVIQAVPEMDNQGLLSHMQQVVSSTLQGNMLAPSKVVQEMKGVASNLAHDTVEAAGQATSAIHALSDSLTASMREVGINPQAAQMAGYVAATIGVLVLLEGSFGNQSQQQQPRESEDAGGDASKPSSSSSKEAPGQARKSGQVPTQPPMRPLSGTASSSGGSSVWASRTTKPAIPVVTATAVRNNTVPQTGKVQERLQQPQLTEPIPSLTATPATPTTLSQANNSVQELNGWPAFGLLLTQWIRNTATTANAADPPASSAPAPEAPQPSKWELQAVRQEMKQRLTLMCRALGPLLSVLPTRDPVRPHADELLLQLEGMARFELDDNKQENQPQLLASGGWTPAGSVPPAMLGGWHLVYATNMPARLPDIPKPLNTSAPHSPLTGAATLISPPPASATPTDQAPAAAAKPATLVDTAENLMNAALHLMTALPGCKLDDVSQTLSPHPELRDGMRIVNSATFSLGLLGTWKVEAHGSWQSLGDGHTWQAWFESLGVHPLNLLGMNTTTMFPQVQVELPSTLRSVSLWDTTYLDGDTRITRGAAGTMFLFSRTPGSTTSNPAIPPTQPIINTNNMQPRTA